MQLRGLVAVFAILLILFSVWLLSYTWFVNKHEKKIADSAQQFMNNNYPEAKKFSNTADYPDSLKRIFKYQLTKMLEASKDEKITWWGDTYAYARSKELNLGLDLQGGMSVTMEVELTGLLRSMSNNSRDPQFTKALENATARKANSDADFISIFAEEFKKLAGDGKMAGIFSATRPDDIPKNATDNKVLEVIRTEAGKAVKRTYQTIESRIDKFGVAQPYINLDESKGIITVDLPGVDDKERVRKFLQTTANLQFWETYTFGTLQNQIGAAVQAYDDIAAGKSTTPDSLNATKPDSITTAAKPDTTKAGKLSDLLGGQTPQPSDSPSVQTPTLTDTKKKLTDYIVFNIQSTPDPVTQEPRWPAPIGSVLIKDTSTVREILELPGIVTKFPADVKFLWGIVETDPTTQKKSEAVGLYAIKTYGSDKAPIEGDAVENASMIFDPVTNQPTVNMSMNLKGASDWAILTDKTKRKTPIAIVLDDAVYSAPVAEEKIEGGNSRVTGSFTVQEATDLASILEVGKLPAPAKIVQDQVVGPTLGAEAIRGGSMAFLISFVVIFILMLVYYNTAGWIANIALILNLLFTVGVLTAFGATLTAPGIAGLVLTIGMAVDTNVIIYERIKEELTKGKGYQLAIKDGYWRSLPPVLDAHITTLLTAIILFYFGLGPVKGFATTQIIGILLSLFCGILVSRWVSDWFTNKKKHLEYFTPISRRIFKHANFKFIQYRKVAYAISLVVLALGIAAIFNGFHTGVEFKGGHSYRIQFDKSKTVDVEAVRKDLEVAFKENPTIKPIGLENQLEITTSYLINDTRPNLDSLIERQLYNGLQNHLNGISFEKFRNESKLGSKSVLPTISDDLKTGARNATIFSLLIIALYIFIRFRDWRYSLGTIIALLHDVLVTLAAFSFLKNVVPFPLELDQHFIAAILTVIGFSMNDTVIVFDRIREYSTTMKGEKKEIIINRAINDTLSRTIMTSLTVFLTILILFIFGGEVTRGFAFAMLIGVITGTYSSIFVAAPVLVDLARGKALGKSEEAVTTTTQKPAAKPATAKS
jgi:SecD/SecF fusion protein